MHGSVTLPCPEHSERWDLLPLRLCTRRVEPGTRWLFKYLLAVVQFLSPFPLSALTTRFKPSDPGMGSKPSKGHDFLRTWDIAGRCGHLILFFQWGEWVQQQGPFKVSCLGFVALDWGVKKKKPTSGVHLQGAQRNAMQGSHFLKSLWIPQPGLRSRALGLPLSQHMGPQGVLPMGSPSA